MKKIEKKQQKDIFGGPRMKFKEKFDEEMD
jgi:hypothetical protein